MLDSKGGAGAKKIAGIAATIKISGIKDAC
jgi:hypothetical protein